MVETISEIQNYLLFIKVQVKESSDIGIWEKYIWILKGKIAQKSEADACYKNKLHVKRWEVQVVEEWERIRKTWIVGCLLKITRKWRKER